ncbi:MAG: hypothetical protein CVT67_08160 [Actinobacteria bacterium HGW-Actinobacteria-7]|jgi:hypothetical protein|nr:MAG: hypothetical protein CVT67_08160 [Actinobacteria bacterium HGW-Actinobacteria-7]
MNETLLAAIDVESAGNLLRRVEQTDALEAGILTPMAGTRPICLFGLEEAERFLVLHEGKTVALGGAWATVNYVDPNHLATWIGETLGDQELSAAVLEIAATRKPYGFLVPEIKSLIATRIEQAKQVLGITEMAAE